MKIAILAAGGKKWNRHSIIIRDENILTRLRRQLLERGISYEDIFLTIGPEDPTPPMAINIIRNPLTGNDLGCIYGIKEHAFDLFIFGDVYFSDAAMDTLLMSEDEFIGRTKTSGVKNYGEIFAIEGTPRVMETLERMWQEYQSGTRKRLWSWDLYSEIQGKDFYKFRNTGNFTEIHDETEDFDRPEEVEKWKTQHESR